MNLRDTTCGGSEDIFLAKNLNIYVEYVYFQVLIVYYVETFDRSRYTILKKFSFYSLNKGSSLNLVSTIKQI